MHTNKEVCHPTTYLQCICSSNPKCPLCAKADMLHIDYKPGQFVNGPLIYKRVDQPDFQLKHIGKPASEWFINRPDNLSMKQTSHQTKPALGNVEICAFTWSLSTQTKAG